MSKVANANCTKDCDRVCDLLQHLLCSFVDLSTQAKQAHWTVKGPNFLSLHAFFDQIAETASEHADMMAERIAALGRYPVGTLRACLAQSSLPEYPGQIRKEEDHLAAMSQSLTQLAKYARECIKDLEGFSDPVSADIVTEVSRELDKIVWQLSSSS